jgi:hypothetical protein
MNALTSAFSPCSGGGVDMFGEDRALLDALCAASAAGTDLEDAARRITGWRAGVKRLRLKGLVGWGGMVPSASALAAYVELTGGRNDPGGPPSLPRLGNNGRWPRWTRAEDERLREAYGAGEALGDVAAELGRPLRGVSSRAVKIGISGDHALGRGGFIKSDDWSENEKRQLRELYGTRPIEYVAAAIGRSKSATYQRAFVLGLRHPKVRTWSEHERQAVRIAHERGIALLDIVPALDRNYAAVVKRAEGLGYRFGKRPRLAEPITLAQILALGDSAAPMPALKQEQPAHPTRRASTRAARPPTAATGRRGWADRDRQDAFVAALHRIGWVRPALAEIGLSRNGEKELAKARAAMPEFDFRCREALEQRVRERQAVRAIGAFARALQPAPPPKAVTVRARRPRPRLTKGPIPPPVRPIATPAPPPPPPRPLSEQPGGVLTRAGSVFNNSWRGRDGVEPPRRHKSDEEIAAESLRYQEERRRHEAAAGATRDLDIESAKRELQRRGRVVHRANLLGGRADRWYVGRLGKEVTDAELIAEAERLLA